MMSHQSNIQRRNWVSSAFLGAALAGSASLVYLASCGKPPELATYGHSAGVNSDRLVQLAAKVETASDCRSVHSNIEELSRILRGDGNYSGYDGYNGYTGYQGYDGYNGYTGYQGYDGYNGYTGYQGYDGYNGYTGYQGYDGYNGYTGYQGYDGYNGYTGYQGYDGYNGYAGDTRSHLLSVLRARLLDSNRRLNCSLGTQIGTVFANTGKGGNS